MQMSVPTLTGISVKIIRKIPGIKQSYATDDIFSFVL